MNRFHLSFFHPFSAGNLCLLVLIVLTRRDLSPRLGYRKRFRRRPHSRHRMAVARKGELRRLSARRQPLAEIRSHLDRPFAAAGIRHLGGTHCDRPLRRWPETGDPWRRHRRRRGHPRKRGVLDHPQSGGDQQRNLGTEKNGHQCPQRLRRHLVRHRGPGLRHPRRDRSHERLHRRQGKRRDRVPGHGVQPLRALQMGKHRHRRQHDPQRHPRGHPHAVAVDQQTAGSELKLGRSRRRICHPKTSASRPTRSKTSAATASSRGA